MSIGCEILVGDALEKLRELPDESVHCVVTSPPYYGLRDYGVDGQIGLEESPGEFVGKLVEVFEEVRRVLRPDGTCWVNMGDSYAGAPGGAQGKSGARASRTFTAESEFKKGGGNYKPKDLMGMPWRLAFALQDAGWWLRQEIIWHKPNPMPESCTDRCCRSHEHVFLLAKSGKYFFDEEAIKEPVSGTAHARGNGVNRKIKAPDGWDSSVGDGAHGTIHKNGREKGAYKGNGVGWGHGAVDGDRGRGRVKQNESFSSAVKDLVSTRKKRSVWTVTTEACKDAHFATFPQALVKPCVLAGTSGRGCCGKCGAPYVREVEEGDADLEHQRACGGDAMGEYHGKATKDFKASKAEDASEVKARILAGMKKRRTVGWRAGCECGAEVVPCVVLDPFGGSGTTGLVALELGRSAILIELNPEYAEMARERTNVTPGLQF